jgi:aminoglycoside phosphotransferase
MVDDIHATRILETGYGWWNIDGKAKANSWREALDQVQIAEDDYKLDNISFFDQDFVNKVHVKIKTYYDLCPDNRYLIHADLIGNIMADNKQVTGVIDWHNSMYGDRIWDIAWFEFWDDKGINYPLLFKEFYKQQGVELENYNERLNCYYLIIGINSMSFFAKSSQQEKYKSAKDKTAQRFNK